jgi:hypothetical protein
VVNLYCTKKAHSFRNCLVLIYMQRYEKYKNYHNAKMVCDTCRKTYTRCNKTHHLRSKYHKLVAYCKKKIIDYNIHGELNKKQHIETVKQQGDITIG